MGKKLAALGIMLCLVLGLAAPAAAAADRAEMVDEVALSPTSPGSEDLDALLDELMLEIFLPMVPEGTADIDGYIEGLSTYEKLEACYDYVMNTVSYGSHTANMGTSVGSTTCRAIYNAYGDIEGTGAVALTAKVGMCNAYAAAFILMSRKIGLDAQLVTGYTISRGGGYTYHEWAEMVIDDVTYVFDPQLDQSMRNQGLGSHNIFFKTYAELGGRYSKG